MKKHRSFKHIQDSDRDRIQALRDRYHSQKEIADILGFSESAISRELSRNPTRVGRYVANRARDHAEEKRSHSKYPGMKIEAYPDMKQYIIRELKRLRSPDEIAGRLRARGVTPRVGTNAIYKWLYSDVGHLYCRFLCTKRGRSRKQRGLSKHILIPDRKPLHIRPNTPGLIHAEGDLFVSPTRLRVKTSGLLVVVPEAHLLTGNIISNKTSIVMVEAMRKLTARLFLDTCTFDNGIENVHHAEFGVDAYFCDRGAPWQKPHVESSIGLIRRWFLPKGTNLALVPERTFQSQLHILNQKYRKSLGYRSAYEVSLERGIIKRVPRISIAAAVAFR
jgi:transposase, IS30 family